MLAHIPAPHYDLTCNGASIRRDRNPIIKIGSKILQQVIAV